VQLEHAAGDNSDRCPTTSTKSGRTMRPSPPD